MLGGDGQGGDVGDVGALHWPSIKEGGGAREEDGVSVHLQWGLGGVALTRESTCGRLHARSTQRRATPWHHRPGHALLATYCSCRYILFKHCNTAHSGATLYVGVLGVTWQRQTHSG